MKIQKSQNCVELQLHSLITDAQCRKPVDLQSKVYSNVSTYSPFLRSAYMRVGNYFCRVCLSVQIVTFELLKQGTSFSV